MKFNQWTSALASVGIVSLGSLARAEEQHTVMTALSSTTISGYVDTSASWWTGKQSEVGGEFGALPGRTFDNSNKQDGFFLNAVKLVWKSRWAMPRPGQPATRRTWCSDRTLTTIARR